MSNWTTKWMDLLENIKQWSKDPHTKVASVIIGPRQEVLAIGYNGLPRGVNDNVPERYERPAKYTWTEHSERNAIFNAAARGIPLEGSTLYSSQFPCADCARGIIQSGVSTVVCPDYEPDNYSHVAVHKTDVAEQMLKEAGVEIVYYDQDTPRYP